MRQFNAKFRSTWLVAGSLFGGTVGFICPTVGHAQTPDSLESTSSSADSSGAGEDADSGEPSEAADADSSGSGDKPIEAMTDAEKDERARTLYLKGNRLYLEGRYKETLVAFREAYRLSGKPLMLYNLANVYERMGRYEEALSTLKRYAPDAPAYEHDTIARRIESLRDRVDNARQPEAEAPTTAVPNPLPPDPLRTDIEPAGKPVLGYSLIGAGAAVLGMGIGFAVAANNARDDASAVCRDGLCPQSASGDVDRDKRFSILADTSMVIGAAGVVTGIVLVATHKRRHRRRMRAAQRNQVRAGVTKHGGGVVWTGRF